MPERRENDGVMLQLLQVNNDTLKAVQEEIRESRKESREDWQESRRQCNECRETLHGRISEQGKEIGVIKENLVTIKTWALAIGAAASAVISFGKELLSGWMKGSN